MRDNPPSEAEFDLDPSRESVDQSSDKPGARGYRGFSGVPRPGEAPSNAPPESGGAHLIPSSSPIGESDADVNTSSQSNESVPTYQVASSSTGVKGSAGGDTPKTTSSQTAEPTAPEPQSGVDGLPGGAATQVILGQPKEARNDVLAANVGDQPSPTDSLGFEPYVEAIASFLINPATKPPLTLSVEGEWGSGKSSFMLQLEEQLRLQNVTVVRFNAWRYDKDEAMWAAFALEFARQLTGKLHLFARWWAHLKLFRKRFQWDRGWRDVVRLVLMLMGLLAIPLLPIIMWERIIPFVTSPDSLGNILGKAFRGVLGTGGILGYLALVAFLFFKLKDIVRSPLKINLKQYLDTPDYKSRVAFIDRFHKDFGDVAETYGKKKKVCVFIDDLDRCEVPKAADLMQALNLMISDNDQLIFIMGMDRQKVAAGLAVKYEKLLPYLAPAPAGSSSQTNATFDPVLGLEYGYKFIEKFIQLPFHVPQASDTQVEEFLKKLLSGNDSSSPAQQTSSQSQSTVAGESAEKAVTEDSEMVTEILKMVAPTFEYNPRRLKQFINAFRLKTFIASKLRLFPGAAETDKPDGLTIQQIGKFVAISLHWPLLLADLDNERDLLSRLQSLVLDKVSPDMLEKREGGENKLVAKIETNQGAVKVTPALARWYRYDDLREFLRVKLFTQEDEVDQGAARIYSLAKLDVNKLLQVSPIPAKPAPTSPADVQVASAA